MTHFVTYLIFLLQLVYFYIAGKLHEWPQFSKSGQTNNRSNCRPISVLPFYFQAFRKVGSTVCFVSFLTVTKFVFPSNLGLDHWTLLLPVFLIVPVTGILTLIREKLPPQETLSHTYRGII